MQESQTSTMQLPIGVISPTDVARLTREVEMLDEYFRQASIRQGGVPNTLPRYSRLLDEMVVTNKLNLIQDQDRQNILSMLQQLDQSAPVMHISFSTDPPGSYVQKIVAWLRSNIDPYVLVRVGLQPNIGAGCVVRTTNKSYDLSLRKYFESKREFFAKKLHEAVQPGVETIPDEPAKKVVIADAEKTVNEPIPEQNVSEAHPSDAVPVQVNQKSIEVAAS